MNASPNGVHDAYMKKLLGAKAEASPEAHESIEGGISLSQALAYEINSSWWASFMFGEFLAGIAGSYYAWKVARRFARYESMLRAQRRQKWVQDTATRP